MADVTITYKGNAIATMDASGTKTLGTQGKYCEDDISVDYDKPSGGGTDYFAQALNKQLTSYASGDVLSIKENGFSHIASLITAELPNCTEVKNYGFQNCSGLTSLKAPKLKTFGSYWLNGCSSLSVLALPMIGGSNINSIGTLPFNGGCDSLEVLDLGEALTRLNTLTNTSARPLPLHTIILRRSSAITTLQEAVGLRYTEFDSGKSGGTIYIPKALYDHLGDGGSYDYKAATNWSTYNGYGTITWSKIEGSIYETQYADGTPIPTS